MDTIFNTFFSQIEKAISKIPEGNIHDKSFIIDCSKLDDYLTNDIRKSENFSQLFKDIEKIDGAAVYWYEIDSSNDKCNIIKTFEEYKKSNDSRPTPAFNHYDHTNSKTLYVGKVQGCLWGRVIQHLGYHKNSTNHGLQLYHWAKPLSLILKLHVTPIDPDMKILLPSLERYYAKELKPLLGRH